MWLSIRNMNPMRFGLFWLGSPWIGISLRKGGKGGKRGEGGSGLKGLIGLDKNWRTMSFKDFRQPIVISPACWVYRPGQRSRSTWWTTPAHSTATHISSDAEVWVNSGGCLPLEGKERQQWQKKEKKRKIERTPLPPPPPPQLKYVRVSRIIVNSLNQQNQPTI